MATQASLQRRFSAAAQHQAAEFSWAPVCLGMVENLIQTGIARIVTDGALSDDIKIALAEANLIRFVPEMMIEARNSGLNELHETSFNAAQIRLCPLWPFC